MNIDFTLINYFVHAGLVIKCVMGILILASIFSWAYILQRSFYLKGMSRSTEKFEEAFWSGEDLTKLYSKESARKGSLDGMNAIFYAGFKEYARFRHLQNLSNRIANTKRAMNAAQMRVNTNLENRLPFLAMVGSTSPYIGLFGTVWGIMQAFRALANVDQATIAMVAPGIAEALIATALGLFAAIPAVIAYNRFITDIGNLTNRFEAFKEEFINALIRQSQPSQPSQHIAEPAAMHSDQTLSFDIVE